MTTKQLGYQAPPTLAIAEGDTTPNPGIIGVSVWSSTLLRLVTWNGTSWDSSMVQRNDLDVSTTGQAVVRKLVAGSGVTLTSSGIDAGTGDVTINASGGGGASDVVASTPVFISQVTTEVGPYSVYVSGRYSYVVCSSSSKLQIFDVTDSSIAPVLISVTATDPSPASVYVAGKYAYVVCNSGKLQVIDISNPAVPVVVGSVVTGGLDQHNGVYVSGKYAYISNLYGGGQ